MTGKTEPNEAYTIQILNAEGHPVIDPFSLTDSVTTYKQDTEALRNLLHTGSLLHVRGHHTQTGIPFADHLVLLQQIGWTHKPIDLPDLSPEQILEIYAGMSSERRQMLIMNAQIKKLVLAGLGGEMTVSDEDTLVDQFFL